MNENTVFEPEGTVSEQVATHIEHMNLVECDAEGKKRYVARYLWPDQTMSDENNAICSRILFWLRRWANLSEEAVEQLTGIPADVYRQIEVRPSSATIAQMVMILDIYYIDISYLGTLVEGFGHVAGDPFETELLARMAYSETYTPEECSAFFEAKDKESADWRDSPVYCDNCGEFIALREEMEAVFAKLPLSCTSSDLI